MKEYHKQIRNLSEAISQSILYFLLISLLVLSNLSFAIGGDTLRFAAHQSTQLEWYGYYDDWVKFPGDSVEIRDIKLNFTLKCGSRGCGYGNHPTEIKILKPTGDFDTVQKLQPAFIVSGYAPDSLSFSHKPTYQRYFDSSANQVDSTKTTRLEAVRYRDTLNPMIPTDTLNVWPAGYQNPVFNVSGGIIDTQYVEPDTTWVQHHHRYHDVEKEFNKYSLARLQTPFGGYMDAGVQGFDSSWSYTYQFDVTDFSEIMRDSVIIRLHNGGWESEFDASVEVEMITDKPAKEVLDVRTLYQGVYQYQNPGYFDSVLGIKRFRLPEEADAAKLRLIMSGYGMLNDKACGAHCKKNYTVNIDQQPVFTKAIWRDDCGKNPIFPQAGNWAENRANWCPGMPSKVHGHLLDTGFLDGGAHSLDIDLDPIQWAGEEAPFYRITAQLITYANLNDNDVAIEKVMAPSQKDEHGRLNPVLLQPRIRLKNAGRDTLNSVRIKYGMKEGALNSYNWSGNLPPMSSMNVKLPAEPDWRGNQSFFKVRLEQPNGKTDSYKANNEARSRLLEANILPEQFVLDFQSNFYPGENEILIYNSGGDTIYQKGSFEPNKRMLDTIDLANQGDRFRLEVNDEGGDGLYYPFSNAGKGGFRIFSSNDTATIQKFPANFGDQLTHEFVTRSATTGHSRESGPWEIKVFPNPASDRLNVALGSMAGKPVKLNLINSLGTRVLSRNYHNPEATLQVDLQGLQPGIYLMKFYSDKGVIAKKVLVK